MATATPPARTGNLNDAHRKIRHPLGRLRTWIRGYVTLEGALVLVLYLALWFWIGLLLDYGTFKLMDYDWVQDMPKAVRVVVLVLLVAGLLAAVTLKVVMRLFTEFRDVALALVLEHRFPKILGDRLITAIELHDTRRAEKQGYSVAMINQTVHEAAARVDQLPIGKVFNWKRLTRQTVAVIALTVVSYALALGGFALADSWVANKSSVGEGVRDFHQVAGIWFERDVLLRDTIWPRRAFLQVISWPNDENGKPLASIAIGQNAPPQAIRVRALQYVVADRKAAEGWRGMAWADVAGILKNQSLPELPGDWQPRAGEPFLPTGVDDDQIREGRKRLMVDVVAIQLNRFDVRKTVPGKEGTWFLADASEEGGYRQMRWSDLSKDRLGGPEVPPLPQAWAATHESDVWTLDEIANLLTASENFADNGKYADLRNLVIARLQRYSDFRDALDALDARLAEPGTSGRARKLIVPRNVTVRFGGTSTNNTFSLTTLPDNEYSGTYSDLKDTGKLPWTFTFRAHGEDYYTPSRQIVVVAAPTLVKLKRQERRPAYLYYQPNGDLTTKDLRGKKQVMSEVDAELFGGDTTRIDVPAGTDVTLTGIADKPLATIRALKKRNGEEELQPRVPFERPDETSFRTTFIDVRQEISFVFEFTDQDGVVGFRSIIIRPAEEHFPDVDLEPQVVRKTKDGYLVTPIVRIPFNGKVTDKFGLSEVRFAYTVAPIEVGASQSVDAALLAAAVPLMNPEGHSYLIGLTYLNIATKNAARAADEVNKRPVQHLNVAGFDKALKGSNQIYDKDKLLNLATVQRLLAEPQPAPYRSLLREYALKPDEWKQAEFDPVTNDFPMTLAKLLETESLKTQKRYRVQLWLEGVNTDVDGETTSDPKVSPSKDKFTFMVVSEGELLAEIGKEEEGLYTRLGEVMSRLQENQAKLTQLVNEDLASGGLKPENFGPMSVRTEDVDQVLDKTQVICKEALTDYQRILQEYRVNQIAADKIGRMEADIVTPLTKIDDLGFPRTRDRVSTFRKALDNQELPLEERKSVAQKAGKDARDQMQLVIDDLQRLLDAMQGLITLDKLIADARKIEEEEKSQRDFLAVLLKRLQDELFGEEPKKK